MLTAAHIYFKAEFNSTYGNPNQNCDAAPASTTSRQYTSDVTYSNIPGV